MTIKYPNMYDDYVIISCKKRTQEKFINGKKQNIDLPDAMCYDDKQANNSQESANLFAMHFSSFYSKEHIVPNHITYDRCLDPPLTEISLNKHYVYQKMPKLPSITSCGPDNIPSIILKECAAELAVSLTNIFNLSLSTGTFPTEWRTSYVTPIYKKKNQIRNYRPIAKISLIPKLLKMLVYHEIRHHN